jgi:hypothetical protein
MAPWAHPASIVRDEALGLAVGLRPVSARAQVAQARRAASERVHRGPVGAAVVGHHALDAHAVGGEEPQRATQERDRRHRLLVGEHLDVGQPGGVIDGDVDVFPSRPSCGACLRGR